MFFLMQIIFIVLPSNMAAVQNLYCLSYVIYCFVRQSQVMLGKAKGLFTDCSG